MQQWFVNQLKIFLVLVLNVDELLGFLLIDVNLTFTVRLRRCQCSEVRGLLFGRIHDCLALSLEQIPLSKADWLVN